LSDSRLTLTLSPRAENEKTFGSWCKIAVWLQAVLWVVQ
jgi:hypothetical protein